MSPPFDLPGGGAKRRMRGRADLGSWRLRRRRVRARGGRIIKLLHAKLDAPTATLGSAAALTIAARCQLTHLGRQIKSEIGRNQAQTPMVI